MMSHDLCKRKPLPKEPCQMSFDIIRQLWTKGMMISNNKFTMANLTLFFLCFGLRYINWHRLGFRYGYNFVMKDLWQPHLIDILANVLEILVFIFSPWSNFGNPNKTFFPFFLFNVSFYLWCFHIYCVDNNNFCISCGITFDLSSNQKLQLNLKTMDIRCEVKT
jgi:hypothetical protein